MPIETTLCNLNQIPIKPVLRPARFIAADQKNRSPLNVKCEGDPPCAIINAEPEFLKISQLRSLQRIHMRPG